MIRHLITVVLSFILASQIHAQFSLPGESGPTSSQSSLIPETTTISPGSTITVALALEHPDEWHSYYLNSGGVELPPSITWSLPDGFTAGPIQWPAPEVKDGYFGKSYVYSGSPVFLVDLTAPASLETGTTVTLKADAQWQICKESCINEEASFTLTLPVADSAEKDPETASLFESARAAIPVTPAGLESSASESPESLTLRLTPASTVPGTPTDFVPDQTFLKSASSGGSITRDGDSWLVTLPRATKDFLDNEIEQGDAVSGILLADAPVAVPLTTLGATAPAPETPRQALSFTAFLPIIGGMLLGGLILNLMPCVFPVIGLKIMGFVQQAGEDRRKIILHGLTFTGGVLASFGVLSGILFVARQSAGDTIGWGYQLQDPWVVLALMFLMFILALNMYGVFEIGASATSVGGSLQSKQGLSGSFFSGVLATVVATPCSAPFLGVAIGAAIALPAFQFFTAFAAMAIGLSLPYLILSSFPKLIDYLPRPGAWMESFKQAMSFLLFATAGYLLWVYIGQIDLANALGPIFGLSAIATAAWIYGRWNLPHKSKRARAIALVLTVAFAIAGCLMSKPPKPSSLVWEKWSEQKTAELLEKDTPVYIDFTAQWCATCQFNKKRAYTDEVVGLINDKGVVTLKADKTKPNPEIEAALEKLGRSAIPVNVLYVPGKDPVVFPELLSPNDLTKALESID